MKFPKEFDYHGGAVALADALGTEPHRIRNWKRQGKVPGAWQDRVLAQVQARKPSAEPKPTVERVRLSDIVVMIADYMRERGM